MVTGEARIDDELMPERLSRHRPFLLLAGARLFSVAAFQMLGVGVGWQIYDMTGSPFALGLIGLAQFLPLIALALFAGHAADRFQRRPLLLICYGVELVAAVSIGLIAAHGLTDPTPIFVLVSLFAAARSFESPAAQALLPSLVSPALFPRAVAGFSSTNQMAVIFSPALGGLLYGVAPIAVFGACAVSLSLAALCVLLLPRAAQGRRVNMPLSLGSLFAGLAFIRGNPLVLGAISLDLFAVLLGGATAMLPVYARDILQAGPLGLGLLRSAPALGAFTTAVLLARHPVRQRAGRMMFAAVTAFALATIAFGFSRITFLSVACLAVLGAADMISMVIRHTLVQLATPDELRGRVSSVNSLFTGTSNQLGEFRAGTMAAWLGPVAAVALGGGATLLVALVWMRLFPTLREAGTLARRPAG